MSPLSTVLIFKIGFTVVFWSIPLLLIPPEWFERLGFPSLETYLFVRLLGWAYLTLCVGYIFALRESFQGVHLLPVIWVGLVSNGGACLILLFYGLNEHWASWGLIAKTMLWLSAVATFSIAYFLYRYGVVIKESASKTNI